MVLAVTIGVVPASSDSTIGDLEVFTIEHLILQTIRSAYVDSIGTADLIKGAIDGMMDQLDPHSSFMEPETASEFKEKIRGDFQGIGITFSIMDDKKITVIEAIPGGPSEQVGITSRDKIVRIDGKSAVGIPQDSVKVLLRGPAGSQVKVGVERPGEDRLMEFTIVRDRIMLNSVSHSYMIDDETGYLAITRFSINTQDDVIRALKKLDALGMKRLVLDLRNNSGGSLEAAVGVVNLFINNGVVVYTRGKRELDNNTWNAAPLENQKTYTNLPMIVMINHASASASEIVAGALQDHDRALIVGQTSFGKGLVMNPFPLVSRSRKNFGTLMLSVAHYYTPSGRLIQRPYENGKDEYIREGLDDIDPNDPDSLHVDAPVYHTDLGREVYGGGGITPDIRLERPRQLNEFEVQLRDTHVFFKFADNYLRRRDDVPKYFDEFLIGYDLPEDELERFRTFAIGEGIEIDTRPQIMSDLDNLMDEYDVSQDTRQKLVECLETSGEELSASLFDQSRPYIERMIKQEIARMKWGSEARYRVWHTEDTELISALACFEDATELLAQRLAIGDL